MSFQYLKRRIRIFPPYVPVSLVLLSLYAALPWLSASGGRTLQLAEFLVSAARQ